MFLLPPDHHPHNPPLGLALPFAPSSPDLIQDRAIMADEAEVLHCNILKCRRMLSEAAVVTSCSHIFCLDCSNAQFHPEPTRRLCPACKTALPSAEEVYVQNLDVGFESRAVFLAGLPPALVLDMATKAIHFFVYQQSQESAFQKLLLKKAQDASVRFCMRGGVEKSVLMSMCVCAIATESVQLLEAV